MVKSRLVAFLSAFILIVTIAAGVIVPVTAFAQETTTTTPSTTPTTSPSPTPTPVTLTLETDVSSYSDVSGTTFSFDVRVKYTGQQRISVNLAAKGPEGFTTTLTYLGKQVSAIDMAADQFGPDTKTINISLSQNAGTLPNPGSYPVTVTATSGEFHPSITLTAIIRAKYSMYSAVDSGLLSTSAVAGKDNHFTWKVVNDGSDPIENVTFSSTGPTGWTVKFNPDKVPLLPPGQQQVVDTIINPPSDKTVAGDYNVLLNASSARASASALSVRVTVTTPSIMGIVAIIIVVVVILALVVLFWRLGRR